MAGSTEGGKKASSTNRAKYGEDFYAKIGAMGGRKGTTGGFFANRKLARIAGKKGGHISKRSWTPEQRAEHGKRMKEAFRGASN